MVKHGCPASRWCGPRIVGMYIVGDLCASNLVRAVAEQRFTGIAHKNNLGCPDQFVHPKNAGADVRIRFVKRERLFLIRDL